MTEYSLAAKLRTDKVNKIRSTGFIPAVVYGNEVKNINIALDKTEFMHIFRNAGTSNLIDLNIADRDKFKTLIHDTQIDPILGEVIHVDFYKVNMKEKIRTEIPLKFIGDSKAVLELEGSLITPKDVIEVECLPADLIPEIEVDISVLDDFEKNIRISDLRLPDTLEVQDDPEEVIAFVEEPRSEEEMAELEEEVKEDVEAVEVEHAGEETVSGEEGEAKQDGENKQKEDANPSPEKPAE